MDFQANVRATGRAKGRPESCGALQALAPQDAPENYIVCRIYARRHGSYSQQHSGVTMIQSNEDRDSVGFFGRGGEWLKASDGKNQRLQLFRVHTAYLSHSGFRWDKLAAECQNPV